MLGALDWKGLDLLNWVTRSLDPPIICCNTYFLVFFDAMVSLLSISCAQTCNKIKISKSNECDKIKVLLSFLNYKILWNFDIVLALCTLGGSQIPASKRPCPMQYPFPFHRLVKELYLFITGFSGLSIEFLQRSLCCMNSWRKGRRNMTWIVDSRSCGQQSCFGQRW